MKLVRFLTVKHMNPTNIERMKGKWAVDVFRPELHGSIQLLQPHDIHGFQDVGPVLTFLETFRKWWDFHDISNQT